MIESGHAQLRRKGSAPANYQSNFDDSGPLGGQFATKFIPAPLVRRQVCKLEIPGDRSPLSLENQLQRELNLP
jgi:hypothetical protein